MNIIHTSLALKIYAYGLRCLHDNNWIEMILYDNLNQYIIGEKEPTNLLQKTIKEGLLYQLGLNFFNDYVLDIEYFLDISDEDRIYLIEELYETILKYTQDENDPKLKKLKSKIDYFEDFYSKDQSNYFDYLSSREGLSELSNIYKEFINDFKEEFIILSYEYANNYAERVFHDRQLCEFISKIVVLIGFDGSYLSEDKTTPKQWIDRKAWPVWAKKAVIARDRGTCSICKKNLMQELDEDENIDHIIPLAKGGNNDLLNLQLLCSKCNNKKRDLIYETKSSIPPYILRKTRKKS